MNSRLLKSAIEQGQEFEKPSSYNISKKKVVSILNAPSAIKNVLKYLKSVNYDTKGLEAAMMVHRKTKNENRQFGRIDKDFIINYLYEPEMLPPSVKQMQAALEVSEKKRKQLRYGREWFDIKDEFKDKFTPNMLDGKYESLDALARYAPSEDIELLRKLVI